MCAESRGVDADPELFPSYPGWDQYFGYGRVDVGAAVEEVLAGAQGPAAKITSPDWFAFFARRSFDEEGREFGSVDSVAVHGEIEAREDQNWSYRLEWGVGSDVDETGWLLLQEGEGQGDFTGEFGHLNVAEVPVEGSSSGCAQSSFPEPFDPLAAGGFNASYKAPELAIGDGILGRVDKLDPYGITLRLVVQDDQGP